MRPDRRTLQGLDHSGRWGFNKPFATARPFGRRPRKSFLWGNKEDRLGDATVFFLGLAGAYSVNVVGSLPGDELLLLPILPILLLTNGKRAFQRQYLVFYVLALGWLLGTFIADVYNGTPLGNRLKGIARVLFLIFDFMALAILINGKARRLVIFALSIVAVMFSYVLEFKGEFLLEWKFGLCTIVVILSLLASSHYYTKRKYWPCVAISLFLAFLNLKYAFRSQMAIILVSAAFSLPFFSIDRSVGDVRSFRWQNLVKLIALCVLAGGVSYLANQAIKFASSLGFFEEELAQKFQAQSAGKLGVLFGGRPETLVAMQAIRDSPIIGHGSFPVDPKYLELKQKIQYEYGYSDTDEPEDVYPAIPTHSHLTMAWVESGFLGGLLWIYILVLTIQGILQIALTRPGLAPLYSYLLVNFVWDNLYSPLGSVNRLWAAYLVLLSYALLKDPANKVRPAMASQMTLLGAKRIVRGPIRPVGA